MIDDEPLALQIPSVQNIKLKQTTTWNQTANQLAALFSASIGQFLLERKPVLYKDEIKNRPVI